MSLCNMCITYNYDDSQLLQGYWFTPN